MKKNIDKIQKATQRMNSKQKPFKDRSEGSRKINKHLRFFKDCREASDKIKESDEKRNKKRGN